VPFAILEELRRQLHVVAHRNLKFDAELLRLLSQFDSSGIEVVIFKGPALAWAFYENPALREMGDLDLLVRPRDAMRAIDLLIGSGYQGASSLGMRFYRKGCEARLLSAESGVAVDLHWQLSPSYLCHGLDAEGLWARLTTVQIAGRAVPALANEDLLVFLCVHGAKHCWSSLQWLADLARLIGRSKFDWDGLIARVHARRISRAVFAGLLIAVDVLGAGVPAGIVERLRAHTAASSIATCARQRLLADLPIASTMQEQLGFQFGLLERAADKFRFCCAQFEPGPEDYKSLPLPAPLFPLYYAFRPLRLMARYRAPAARRTCGIE